MIQLLVDQAFEWFARLKEGRTSAEDDKRGGRPIACQSEESIAKN